MPSTGITGVLGQRWRADVTSHGALEPWDGSPTLDWHVAADDRWHTPAQEVSLRQRRLLGAPVFETRVHVPGGDAVQRVWSVPDAGGLTVVELINDSPLPLACALTRADLLAARPPAAVPIEGIDLPAETTTVVPIGHRASTAVALAHTTAGPGRLTAGLPPADAVARGWVTLADRASRLVLPDTTLADAVVAARSDLLLRGVVPIDEDPAACLLGLCELVRMGERVPDDAALEVADAVARVARAPGWDVDAALDAAAVVLATAGEHRAGRDLSRIRDRRSAVTAARRADGIRDVAAIERRLLRGATLFPDGFPSEWPGADLEAHGMAAGPATRLSFAVRWHGARPAVLWEAVGEPVELTAPAIEPGWRTSEPSGEHLWPPVGTR